MRKTDQNAYNLTGGHCIAVDPWFIVSKTPDLARIVNMARVINDGKPEWVKGKVHEALLELVKSNYELKDIRIACFGLTFKPDIDDLRESPSLNIASDLAKEFPYQVVAVEPNIKSLPESISQTTIKLVAQEDGLKANIIILLVDHTPFKYIRIKLRDGQYLIDTKGIWNK